MYIVASIKNKDHPRQMIAYRTTKWSSKWNTQNNSRDRNFIFANLYQPNMISRQLYLWSAPMDAAERDQSHLNQLSTTNRTSMEILHFYNCTPPRIGSKCQYKFDDYQHDHSSSSLDEIIHDFYLHN